MIRRTPSRAGRLTAMAGVCTLAFGLAACSSVPRPTDEMAVARSTVERVTALPNTAAAAPIELQQAREKLARAEQALADKRYAEARRLAQEAEVDARLAESKAQASVNQQALEEVRRANQALSEELDKPSAVQAAPVPPASPAQPARPPASVPVR